MKGFIAALILMTTPLQAEELDIVAMVAEFKTNYAMDITAYPSLLGEALVAAEDRNFHQRNPFRSPITRFAFTSTDNLVQRRRLNSMQVTQGQIAMATSYSHDQIIALTLETAYFGRRCFGATDAAMGIFGVDVMDLSAAQQIALVTVLKAPSRFWEDASFLSEHMQFLAKILTEDGVIDAQADGISAKIDDLDFNNLGQCLPQ